MTNTPPQGELIVYRTEDGKAAIHLRVVDGTVWLTQAEIAALFDTTPQNITQHIRGIYEDGEQTEAATCKELLQVHREGDRAMPRIGESFCLAPILTNTRQPA